jgi:RNA polymerase sigma-70 factor, ECF subfamily
MHGSLSAPAERSTEDATTLDPHREEPASDRAVFEFKALYEEHFAFVWRNLQRFGVRKPELDDAVQDVFIVVHRKLSDFQPKASIRAWIFGIVASVARTHRRTRARKEVTSAAPVDRMGDVKSQDPEALLQCSQAKRTLEAILDSMRSDEREVFIWVELEQMRGPEIAEALGISVNTVYSRLRAARRDFQQGLARLTVDVRRRP